MTKSPLEGAMNWDALGAVAESLGAIGVVVSLIYLAIQIQRNTSAIRANTAQQVTNRGGEIAEAVATQADLADIQRRGLVEPDSLTAAEKFRFSHIMNSIFRAYENMDYQHRIGLLDDDIWTGLDNNLKKVVKQPGFREWWRSAGDGYNQEFQNRINAIVGP